MTQEEIQSFTRRITESNPTELVVVLYDIYLIRMRDAKASCEKYKASSSDADLSEMNRQSKAGDKVLDNLMADLDFTYEISNNLYSLYDYCKRKNALFRVKLDSSLIEETESIIKELRDAFEEIAKEDTRDSGLSNAQQVAAGYTYGRTSLNEIETNYDVNRGFKA